MTKIDIDFKESWLHPEVSPEALESRFYTKTVQDLRDEERPVVLSAWIRVFVDGPTPARDKRLFGKLKLNYERAWSRVPAHWAGSFCRRHELEAAIEALQEHFGASSIQWGGHLGEADLGESNRVEGDGYSLRGSLAVKAAKALLLAHSMGEEDVEEEDLEHLRLVVQQARCNSNASFYGEALESIREIQASLG